MVPGILALTGFLLVLFVQPPLLRCNKKGWDYAGDLEVFIKKKKTKGKKQKQKQTNKNNNNNKRVVFTSPVSSSYVPKFLF